MTKLEIWNAALAAVGHDQTIASVTENSTEAIRCRMFWDLARKTTLRKADWSFALKTLTLGSPVSTTSSGSAYAAPDAVRLSGVKDATGFPVTCELRDGMVYVAAGLATGAQLFYVADEEDTSLYDPEFTLALIYALAERLAFPMTGKPDLTKTMHALFVTALSEAKATDANESRVTGDHPDVYERARR